MSDDRRILAARVRELEEEIERLKESHPGHARPLGSLDRLVEEYYEDD